MLAAIPPRESTTFALTILGVYYAAKADFVGAADGKSWYQRSLAILLKAPEISRAISRRTLREPFLHSNRCILHTCKEYPGAQLRSARCCSSRPSR